MGYDHHFYNSLIDSQISGSPTPFYRRSPELEVATSKDEQKITMSFSSGYIPLDQYS
jgi:hypothetical protein